MVPRPAFLGALLLLCPSVASAQSNQNPDVDIRLARLNAIGAEGRTGVFPDGLNGISFATTACNEGNVDVPWRAPMNPNHPFIAFLVAREMNGRMEQISDRSYVKHGFFALQSEFCGTCNPPGGEIGGALGVGCSDTYGRRNNSDRFYLGPADEIDPWLGSWDSTCSHFDRGEPPVAPPFDCDGGRSLSAAMVAQMGPVTHRIEVKDADLDVTGALFYYQAQYVVKTEPEVERDDNMGAREFSATWDGSEWVLSSIGSLMAGSVLERWAGATVSSNTNGADDGRVYVAAKVTGPDALGFYRYEYALHNRDNARGVGTFRIPVCDGARVANLGFSDIDDDAANDWTVSVDPTEIVFSANGNPLRWNTIYNVWFDSDAAPEMVGLTLEAFDAGTGAAAFAVSNAAPVGLYNAYIGPGCAQGTPPTLYATGTPARASLGNATFALESTGNQPGELNVLRYGLADGTFLFQGCTFRMAPSLVSTFKVATTTTDAFGVARHPIPIPNDLALEGLEVNLQAIGRNPGAGVLFVDFEVSDALKVRVGDAVAGCP